MIRMINVLYLSEKVVVFCGNQMFSFQNVTFELKYIKRIPLCHVRIRGNLVRVGVRVRVRVRVTVGDPVLVV